MHRRLSPTPLNASASSRRRKPECPATSEVLSLTVQRGSDRVIRSVNFRFLAGVPETVVGAGLHNHHVLAWIHIYELKEYSFGSVCIIFSSRKRPPLELIPQRTAGYELAGLHLRRAWRRGFIDPFCRHNLISVRLTVVQKEHSETLVVAQRGLYAAEGRFRSSAVGEPRRIVLHSKWLPYFSRQIVGGMLACSSAHKPSEHLGVDAPIVEAAAGLFLAWERSRVILERQCILLHRSPPHV